MISLKELYDRRPEEELERNYFQTRRNVGTSVLLSYFLMVGLVILVQFSEDGYVKSGQILGIYIFIGGISIFTYYLLDYLDSKFGLVWRITIRQRSFKPVPKDILSVTVLVTLPGVVASLSLLISDYSGIVRPNLLGILFINGVLMLGVLVNSINMKIDRSGLTVNWGSLFSQDNPTYPRDQSSLNIRENSLVFTFSFLLSELLATFLVMDMAFLLLKSSRNIPGVIPQLMYLTTSICLLLYPFVPPKFTRYELAQLLFQCTEDPYVFNTNFTSYLIKLFPFFRRILVLGYIQEIQDRIELMDEAGEDEVRDKWKKYFSSLHKDLVNYQDVRLIGDFLYFKDIELTERERTFKEDLDRFEKAGIGRSEFWEKQIKPRIWDTIFKIFGILIPSFIIYILIP